MQPVTNSDAPNEKSEGKSVPQMLLYPKPIPPLESLGKGDEKDPNKLEL